MFLLWTLPTSCTLSSFPNAPSPSASNPLSLHDALPILRHCREGKIDRIVCKSISRFARNTSDFMTALNTLHDHQVTILFEKEGRSEEHTSELQSRFDLVCRLLLEKKNRIRVCERSRTYK